MTKPYEKIMPVKYFEVDRYGDKYLFTDMFLSRINEKVFFNGISYIVMRIAHDFDVGNHQVYMEKL